jgi:stearoyl-CoA desaturase (delta-9 desaturase)
MRIAMTLKQTKAKLVSHPNTEQILIYLQQKYELLINKINAYYLVRKRVLEVKQENLVAEVENSDLMTHYKELKERLTEQRRS